MALELYVLPGCPYCEKVENKMEELDLLYTAHEVPARRAERDSVQQVSGQTQVPVLVDKAHGIDGMPESDDIVDYLERRYSEIPSENLK